MSCRQSFPKTKVVFRCPIVVRCKENNGVVGSDEIVIVRGEMARDTITVEVARGYDECVVGKELKPERKFRTVN